MAHQWKRLHNRTKVTRVCLNCGKEQTLDYVDYSIMDGSTRRWLPLAGRCVPNKPAAGANSAKEKL